MRGIFGKKNNNNNNELVKMDDNTSEDSSPSSYDNNTFNSSNSSTSTTGTTTATTGGDNRNNNKPTSSSINTFFKKATTVSKHKIMKTIGKAEEIEFPEDYNKNNAVFKDNQNHYKEVDKLLKKLTKSNQNNFEDELSLGHEYKNFSAAIKQNYLLSTNESWSNTTNTYYTNVDVNRLVNMYDQLGSTLEQLAELKNTLNSDISSILHAKVHETISEGELCKNLKEYYRESLVEENVTETKYNTLRTKSNDLVKIKQAEKDFEQSKKVSEKLHTNIMKEFQFQEELRDYEYSNSLRQFISSYRTFFIQGSAVLDELEKYLINPSSRSTTREYDTNEIINYKDNLLNQQPNNNLNKKEKVKEEKQLFGVPLVEVMKRKRELNRDVIPNMCIDLFNFVEQKGLQTEGIFRLAGEVIGMNYLKKLYDNGKKHIDLAQLILNKEIKDIHVVAGVLKMYIRELPEPLLTHNLYEKFLDFTSWDEESCQNEIINGLTDLIKQIPIEHICLLDKLLTFLSKIADHSNENKMTVSNISIVFGVNILKSSDSSPMKMAKDSSAVNRCFELLLKYYVKNIAPSLKPYIDNYRQFRIQQTQLNSNNENENDFGQIEQPFNAMEEEFKKKNFLPPPNRNAVNNNNNTNVSSNNNSTPSTPNSSTLSGNSTVSSGGNIRRQLPPTLPKKTAPPLPSKVGNNGRSSIPKQTTTSTNPMDDMTQYFNSTNTAYSPSFDFDSNDQFNQQLNPNSNSNNRNSGNNNFTDPNDFFN
ncbi:hypothetical protein ABK040_006785 [Willaertia magna]